MIKIVLLCFFIQVIFGSEATMEDDFQGVESNYYFDAASSNPVSFDLDGATSLEPEKTAEPIEPQVVEAVSSAQQEGARTNTNRRRSSCCDCCFFCDGPSNDFYWGYYLGQLGSSNSGSSTCFNCDGCDISGVQCNCSDICSEEVVQCLVAVGHCLYVTGQCLGATGSCICELCAALG